MFPLSESICCNSCKTAKNIIPKLKIKKNLCIFDRTKKIDYYDECISRTISTKKRF